MQWYIDNIMKLHTARPSRDQLVGFFMQLDAERFGDSGDSVQAESACCGAGVYCEMADGCSMAALRVRHNLNKLLHQGGAGSRGKAKELLVGADPSRSCLVHRLLHIESPLLQSNHPLSIDNYYTQKPHQTTVVFTDTVDYSMKHPLSI